MLKLSRMYISSVIFYREIGQIYLTFIFQGLSGWILTFYIKLFFFTRYQVLSGCSDNMMMADFIWLILGFFFFLLVYYYLLTFLDGLWHIFFVFTSVLLFYMLVWPLCKYLIYGCVYVRISSADALHGFHFEMEKENYIRKRNIYCIYEKPFIVMAKMHTFILVIFY